MKVQGTIVSFTDRHLIVDFGVHSATFDAINNGDYVGRGDHADKRILKNQVKNDAVITWGTD